MYYVASSCVFFEVSINNSQSVNPFSDKIFVDFILMKVFQNNQKHLRSANHLLFIKRYKLINKDL